MNLLDRLTRFLVRLGKARHARWLRRNRVLLAPDRAVVCPRLKLEAGKIR